MEDNWDSGHKVQLEASHRVHLEVSHKSKLIDLDLEFSHSWECVSHKVQLEASHISKLIGKNIQININQLDIYKTY